MNDGYQSDSNINLSKKKNSLKIILYILLGILTFLISLIVIFSLVKKDISTRTFMIYMVGSDLESKNSMGTYELDGIDPSLVDLENINVVLIAGGSKIWKNDYIDEKETSIYQLTNNGFVKVKSQQIKNMGDSSTLSNFINFVTEHYITDKYELLFWNHGGAINGSEYDELNGNDNLSLEEMKKALSETSFNNKNKIETVIFSTCLNGTIENANVFKDYANYFVASEEISMSVKYNSDFSFINDVTTETKSLDIGKMFINKYKEKMSNLKKNYEISVRGYDIYSTYSIVDLNNIEKLNDAIDNFFSKIDVISNYNTIAKVRSNLYQYAYQQSGEAGYDMVDLYNLLSNLKQLSPKEAQNVLNELENTIIYNYATDSSSRGISIYFPYNGSSKIQDMFLNIYDNISSINNYNNFIVQFNSIKNANSTNRLSFASNKSTINLEDKESDFELELTDEQLKAFAKAEYMVFRDNKNGYYLPVYRGKKVKLEDNRLFAKIKDRQLKISTDSYESIITLIEEETTDTYIKYSTFGMLQDLSSNEMYEWTVDTAKISIVLDKKNNKIQMTDAILINKNNLPSKINVNIKNYTTLSFGSSSYKILNDNAEFIEDWESNGILEGIEIDPSGDYKIELEDYDDGYDYYCIFKIFDINNNSYYSKLIKMK